MPDIGGTKTVWRRLALPVSLVLNLFFAAVIGGHLLSGHFANGDDREPMARALVRAEARLSSKDAAAFAAVMRHDGPQFVPAAKQLAVARAVLDQRIRAEHFDPAQVKQAMVAWQAAWQTFFDDVSGPLVDALEQVSPDGRRRLIARRWAVGHSRYAP